MSEGAAKVPPNGKWGWMIVLAYALNGISTVPIFQGLGLVFKDTFPRFGFNATEAAIIINTNLAFGMVLGLINGPLLRIFGYRKMAIFGSLLYCIGVTMTAFIRSFTLFIVFYGIIASLGMSITFSAFSYALNSYFTTKRGRAMSLALTMIGLGPIIVPQVTTVSLSYYGFQGTVLLFGAYSLHSLVGSLLLQPLKWHTKSAKVQSNSEDEELIINGTKSKSADIKSGSDEKNTNFQEDEYSLNSVLDLSNLQKRRKRTTSKLDYDSDIGSIYGFDILFSRQLSETMNVSSGEKDVDVYRNRKQHDRYKSVDTINLGSSVKIFDERSGFERKHSNLSIPNANDFQMENNLLLKNNSEKEMVNTGSDSSEESEKKSVMKQILQKINHVFDLDLLKDPIYVNIMVGMSAAIFAEANFSTLTPFILMDMKLSTKEIGIVMSIIGSLDLVFRMMAPFLGEWFHQPPRIMYLISLCLLIISRSSIIFVNAFTPMVIVAVGLGIAKGIRTVYMSLVIPHYVPIEKLPNASGIQMIVNGLFLLTAGPILGVIRDRTGSYAACIVMMNFITAFTVVIWTVEMLIVRRRRLRMGKQQEANS
ncbi:uncharacterized protein LOC122402967 [Colletes gigas]|uniref:uncharacterized protein LOC122402967 n=1 Tax=Colletes gigas TaxID=935657 RepID=UPI001C9B3819|nr:uncharacterized protein LOC122402967 [Colletes gigas]